MTCQHYGKGGKKPDCEAVAVWRFLIMGVPTFSCDKHRPAYAKSATKV